MVELQKLCKRHLSGTGHVVLDIDSLEEEAWEKGVLREDLISSVADLFETVGFSEEESFSLLSFDYFKCTPYSEAIQKRWSSKEEWKPAFEAHSHSFQNREGIEKGSLCGCFFCLDIFSPKDIKKWVRKDDTALCPKCHIDSVIGDESGHPITKEFLWRMQQVWFGHQSIGTKGPNWKK